MVERVRGVDLAVGDRVWSSREQTIYSDAGYFAVVERVVEVPHGTAVFFEQRDPLVPREAWSYVTGTGADTMVLRLVEIQTRGGVTSV